MRLFCHIHGDSDLLEAWMRHYRSLGVGHFHFIVHGAREDNALLYALRDRHPMTIEDSYGGEFINAEKGRRLNRLIEGYRDQWIVLVDSDEFVEFPYETLAETVSVLERFAANALFAPMLQRIRADGGLDTPDRIDDPLAYFSQCSPDLYRLLGGGAVAQSKYPLLYCHRDTRVNSGNHSKPHGPSTVLCNARGVTHHVKWRRNLTTSLAARIASRDRWRHESMTYRTYLERHGHTLPLDGSFAYSRERMVREGYVRRPTAAGSAALRAKSEAIRTLFRLLPQSARRWYARHNEY